MQISSATEQDILRLWLRESVFVRAEAVGANIGLSFTGVVARYSAAELVLSRSPDEMSISLLGGKCSVFEPGQNAEGWERYRRIVQIITDGGAQCTLYELREGVAA